MMDDRYSHNDRTQDRATSSNLPGRLGNTAHRGGGPNRRSACLQRRRAGPDRTRTAEYSNLNSKPASTGLSPTGDSRGPGENTEH
jgi:hypothetical protein